MARSNSSHPQPSARLSLKMPRRPWKRSGWGDTATPGRSGRLTGEMARARWRKGAVVLEIDAAVARGNIRRIAGVYGIAERRAERAAGIGHSALWPGHRGKAKCDAPP
jgi:hypothetical protein